MDERDHDPIMKVLLPDGEFQANLDNARLYCYVGDLASRSHVFLQTEPLTERGTMPGVYIFQPSPNFQQMANFMMKNGFQLHLNLRQVQDNDEEAYQVFIDQMAEWESEESPDFLPDDWK